MAAGHPRPRRRRRPGGHRLGMTAAALRSFRRLLAAASLYTTRGLRGVAARCRRRLPPAARRRPRAGAQWHRDDSRPHALWPPRAGPRARPGGSRSPRPRPRLPPCWPPPHPVAAPRPASGSPPLARRRSPRNRLGVQRARCRTPRVSAPRRRNGRRRPSRGLPPRPPPQRRPRPSFRPAAPASSPPDGQAPPRVPRLTARGAPRRAARAAPTSPGLDRKSPRPKAGRGGRHRRHAQTLDGSLGLAVLPCAPRRLHPARPPRSSRDRARNARLRRRRRYPPGCCNRPRGQQEAPPTAASAHMSSSDRREGRLRHASGRRGREHRVRPAPTVRRRRGPPTRQRLTPRPARAARNGALPRPPGRSGPPRGFRGAVPGDHRQAGQPRPPSGGFGAGSAALPKASPSARWAVAGGPPCTPPLPAPRRRGLWPHRRAAGNARRNRRAGAAGCPSPRGAPPVAPHTAPRTAVA
mmetsp:Transcript_21721/g.60683  ORF Transcript_21721/g.60683 Transcript_21721/m.60683 type:complete len:467 (+) Transcript_21721:289-1689(+)